MERSAHLEVISPIFKGSSLEFQKATTKQHLHSGCALISGHDEGKGGGVVSHGMKAANHSEVGIGRGKDQGVVCCLHYLSPPNRQWVRRNPMWKVSQISFLCHSETVPVQTRPP